ncbi:hypothetical protein PLESTB_000722900 [Pleodorina starrii]|uniref:MYND-type domain-containing protein n=1 Tax=Pleodorina starrii TaxID=330485 RepID=A0A9W6F2I3_9CHLO|nr:hypothetical protein PLESTB_000722900 [Pleodorina starrii]
MSCVPFCLPPLSVRVCVCLRCVPSPPTGTGAQTLQMAVRCLDMLGGPLCHEGTLTAEEKGYLARLATAAGSDIGALIAATPLHVLAIYMLQVQYDIDLRIVKWVLHYVAARCCKEAYARVRTGAPGSSRGSPAGIAARSAWLSHSAALGKLDPGCPLAAYMVAEARGSTEGSHPETLAVMRAAAATAERRGDDLIAWLARLNVAYTIIHGGCGDTFSEDEVMQVSLRRWGGAVILEPRCKALKESLMKALQASREQKQKQLAEAAAAAAAAASSSSSAAAAVVDDGRLPTFILRQDQWAVLTPVPVPHRQCAGCKKLFHKAMACGKCKQVWYCGRDCQLAHWKAGHKKECAELAARAAETAAAAAAGPEDVD